MSFDVKLRKTFLADRSIYEIIRNNQNEQLLALIEQKIDVNKRIGPCALTLLDLAAIYNNKAAAKLLIDNKADINGGDRIDYSPLHHAAENRSLAVLKTLIFEKADINVENANGDTPCNLARRKNNIREFLELGLAGADISICNRKQYKPQDDNRLLTRRDVDHEISRIAFENWKARVKAINHEK